MLKRSPRLLIALLLLPALAVFAACSGGDDDDSEDDTSPALTATTAGSSSPAATSPTAASTNSGLTNASAKKLDAHQMPLDTAKGTFLGSEAAKVTLTVYEDFQCPHCLNYTVNVEPTLIDEYVKTGKVRLEFQNLPILGQESVLAAIGGHCAAEQNLFWQYHRKLFLVQAEAGQLTDEKVNAGRFSGENIVKYATEVGADSEAFSTCVVADTTVAELTQQLAAAQALGFRGTPSFAINGVAQAGQPATLAAWRTLLDKEIAAAK